MQINWVEAVAADDLAGLYGILYYYLVGGFQLGDGGFVVEGGLVGAAVDPTPR